jgi:hypothetical protein
MVLYSRWRVAGRAVGSKNNFCSRTRLIKIYKPEPDPDSVDQYIQASSDWLIFCGSELPGKSPFDPKTSDSSYSQSKFRILIWLINLIGVWTVQTRVHRVQEFLHSDSDPGGPRCGSGSESDPTGSTGQKSSVKIRKIFGGNTASTNLRNDAKAAVSVPYRSTWGCLTFIVDHLHTNL